VAPLFCFQKAAEALEELRVATDQAEAVQLARFADLAAAREQQLQLATNHALHYASTEPAAAARKPKPPLKPKRAATGLDAGAPLLNKHYSGYAGEVELGDSGSPKKKPDLAALSSLRKNRLAKAASGQEDGLAGEAEAVSSSSSSSSSSGFNSIGGFSGGGERPHGGNPSPSSVANAPVLHGPSGNGGLSAEGSARLEAARASRNSKASSGASPLRAAAGGGPLPRPKPPTPRPRSPRAARTSPEGL
jgi:hypothetical protein